MEAVDGRKKRHLVIFKDLEFWKILKVCHVGNFVEVQFVEFF